MLCGSEIQRNLVSEVCDFISSQTALTLAGATYSPIKGPEGNIEFLFLLTKNSDTVQDIDFEKIVNDAHMNAK